MKNYNAITFIMFVWFYFNEAGKELLKISTNIKQMTRTWINRNDGLREIDVPNAYHPAVNQLVYCKRGLTLVSSWKSKTNQKE